VKKQVIVAGGGLAGLTAARQLARAGLKVTVLESADRAGGKAGADKEGGTWREHGYHIFPPWYLNTRALLSELQVPLVDFDSFHFLRENEREQLVSVPVPRSLPTIVQALQAGLFPWYESFLYGYFALDALAEPMSNAGLLDQVSRIGLMRSRWYVTDSIPSFEQENLLKASAIPAHDMSAMTVKKVFSLWARSPFPFLSILPGDMQSSFIEPLVRDVVASGAVIKLNEPIISIEEHHGRVSSVTTRSPDGSTQRYTADAFLITTPLEVTRRLIGGKLQALDPELGNFEHLEAAPMAALHIDFNRKLPWTPREHVMLHQGRYGLSFIDLAHHWPGQEKSQLSFIASNFIPLRDLTPEEQFDALYQEISKYMTIRPGDITGYSLKPNVETPLFINRVGAWPNRPDVRSDTIRNLYFAGDWVKNPIDLACMEGTVMSALSAAREMAHQLHAGPTEEPIEPREYPEMMFRALKYMLAPALVPLYAYARARKAIHELRGTRRS
jgi:15-cis-phytoene desaturase